MRIGARAVERRQQADQQPAGERQRQTPPEHPKVDARLEAERLELPGNERARAFAVQTRRRRGRPQRPRSTSRRLSVRTSRTRRHRAAPSASRTASSRCRAVERARKRFVRLAQAMRSTSPTAPSRMKAAGRTSLKSAAAHGVAVSCQFSYSANCPFSACSTRLRDRRELGVGLLHRRARSETREHVELADVASNGQRISTPWNPQVGADEDEPWRHDADDRHRASADADRAAEDCGIAAEAALPEAMADDRGGRTIRTELLACEAAAQCRRHADHRKEIVEQQSREDTLGHVAARDVAVAEIERAGVREAAGRPDVEVLGRRQRLDVGRLGRELRETSRRPPPADPAAGRETDGRRSRRACRR